MIQHSFSIFLTSQGVEIHPGKFFMEQSELICFCQHPQAALRIARNAAQLHRQPLFAFIEQNSRLHRFNLAPK